MHDISKRTQQYEQYVGGPLTCNLYLTQIIKYLDDVD